MDKAEFIERTLETLSVLEQKIALLKPKSTSLLYRYYKEMEKFKKTLRVTPDMVFAGTRYYYDDIFTSATEGLYLNREEAEVKWPYYCLVPMYYCISYFDDMIKRGRAKFNPVEEEDYDSDEGRATVAANFLITRWGYSKGIYRFDSELYEELLKTDLSKELPCDILLHLPECCLYVELPESCGCVGFFATLDYDLRRKTPTLLLGLVELDSVIHNIYIALDKGSLVDNLYKGAEACFSQIIYTTEEERKEAIDRAKIAISLLLYIASEQPDISNRSAPKDTPFRGVRVKRANNGELKLAIAPESKIWDVGVKEGHAIRQVKSQVRKYAEGGKRCPHIRRSHWHLYWTGHRDEPDDRKPKLNWVMQTFVNKDEMED